MLKSTLSLAWKGGGMNREGLAARDRTVPNGGDQLNFHLRRLHSLKYLWETAALRGGVQVMEDDVVRVILAEDCNKAFIKVVNQCITNTLGELGFTSEWAHCVHHMLVIGEYGSANNVAIAINI